MRKTVSFGQVNVVVSVQVWPRPLASIAVSASFAQRVTVVSVANIVFKKITVSQSVSQSRGEASPKTL